jgi:hypothetical protein
VRITCRHGSIWEWVDFAWPNMAGRGEWHHVRLICDCSDPPMPGEKRDIIEAIAEAAED